jgi:DNA-binding NarL/FixJ family response regulator
VRIMLVDDHALVRAAIRALLATLPQVAEVVEAADGREALANAAMHRPDVILMDISMPGLNGLEALARIVKRLPATKVLVFSMHHNPAYVRRALRLGAAGYLVKDALPTELEHALEAAACGQVYLSPAVAFSAKRAAGCEPSSLEQLTPRQREVLQLIAEGHKRSAIARTLKVGLKTVESHRTQLMKELDIHNVAGLVRYALSAGVIDAE